MDISGKHFKLTIVPVLLAWVSTNTKHYISIANTQDSVFLKFKQTLRLLFQLIRTCLPPIPYPASAKEVWISIHHPKLLLFHIHSPHFSEYLLFRHFSIYTYVGVHIPVLLNAGLVFSAGSSCSATNMQLSENMLLTNFSCHPPESKLKDGKQF